MAAEHEHAPETTPDSKTATVTLNTPIRRTSGMVIDTLTLRKPNGGDLRGYGLKALMEIDVNTVMGVLPRIAQPHITEQEALALEVDDLMEIGGTLYGFFMTPVQKKLAQEMAGISPPTT